MKELIGKKLDLHINPHLDLGALTELYKKDKTLVIENFLSDESAHSLYDFYVMYMPKDWWHISYAGVKPEVNIDRLTVDYLKDTKNIKDIYDTHHKDKEEKKQDQKPQPGKLSPQQMKQLLEAMNNEEKKTQDKMNAKKERGKKIKQEKDW